MTFTSSGMRHLGLRYSDALVAMQSSRAGGTSSGVHSPMSGEQHRPIKMAQKVIHVGRSGAPATSCGLQSPASGEHQQCCSFMHRQASCQIHRRARHLGHETLSTALHQVSISSAAASCTAKRHARFTEGRGIQRTKAVRQVKAERYIQGIWGIEWLTGPYLR